MILMIYDRSAHNLDITWHTISHVPKFNEMVGTKKLCPEENINDFHFVLTNIFNGIKKL